MASIFIHHRKTIAASVLFVIAFPFLLNLLVSIPAPTGWPIAGKESDWLVFWATYITSLASFAMVIAAYKSLSVSRRQWEMANTAHIVVMTYQDKYHQVYMRICNMSSIGVIIQSIQVCSEPSNTVKDLFCFVKSNEHLDNYMKWQHTYGHSFIVIRPYEYEDILLLQHFPRQLDEKMSFIIKYNNTSTEVNLNLDDIVIIQDDNKCSLN